MRWRRQKPMNDPTSIGNLLCAAGAVDAEHIKNALDFQKEHADVLLGEALVRLGLLTRPALEVAIAQQKAVRTSKPVDARRLVELATQRTMDTTAAISEVTAKFIIPRAKTKNA